MFTFAVLICGVRGISPGNAVFSLEPRVVDSESITQPATRGHMVDRAVWAAVEHAAADSGATDPAEKAETAAEPGYEGPVYLWQFSKPKSPPPPGYTYDGSPPVPQEDNILPPRVDTVPVAVQDVVEDLKDKVKNGPVDVGNEVEMLDKVTNHAIKQDAAKEKPGAAPEKAPSDAAESQVKMKATDNVTPDFKPLAMDTLSRGVKKLRQFGKNLGLRMIPPIDPVGLGVRLTRPADAAQACDCRRAGFGSHKH
ncbi:MAG: hypothetical protein KVP17_001013 [Porospora cf. gigantea B]|uniref:uncharacterized protein n=1 Tax=Porospora cf. gigantea B TaxID=2853592 RepID=UPI003571EF11|nr:MAG: hypothetical protein KVP17_001013 [Porospora cf. gigantea B]